MILLPSAIDFLGCFELILQHFIFDIQPTSPPTCMPAEPNATSMSIYSKLTCFPSPKGILNLADHNWKTTHSRQFYGHLYSAPTPTITTIQQLGLTLTKAFPLHIHYTTRKIHDQSIPTPPLCNPDSPYFGQQVGF